jgi:glutathione S-transferase
MNSTYPILYSFRRCPYAMRARLAIVNSGLKVELREVKLRMKPQQLLDISPKGTVPVLQLNNKVIDESLDIMYWALSINDPANWVNNHTLKDMEDLIKRNDGEFKYYLDRYKYTDRYPEQNQQFYRKKAELFLVELENRLSKNSFLCGEKCSLADIAIFPFIRQFAIVDIEWFYASDYRILVYWLQILVDSVLFKSIMKKYQIWKPEDEPIYLI